MEILTFNFSGAGDKDAAAGFKTHRGMTVIGLNKKLANKSGAVTAHTVDLNVGADPKISAKCSGAGQEVSYPWLTPELGGSEEAFDIPAGSEVTFDFNQTGGGTIDITLALYVLQGQV